MKAVLAVTNNGDAIILGELLADPNVSVVTGAQAALIALAAVDLEKIRPNIPRKDWLDRNILDKTSAPSVHALRDVASGNGSSRARASAVDALIEIEVSERRWRETHPPIDRE